MSIESRFDQSLGLVGLPCYEHYPAVVQVTSQLTYDVLFMFLDRFI